MLPDVAARAQSLQRLAELGAVTRLPPDASARRIAAETRLRDAQAAVEQSTANRARLIAERDATVDAAGDAAPDALRDAALDAAPADTAVGGARGVPARRLRWHSMRCVETDNVMQAKGACP
jgi:hypothetical protein